LAKCETLSEGQTKPRTGRALAGVQTPVLPKRKKKKALKMWKNLIL
jgi:hypothetical protein